MLHVLPLAPTVELVLVPVPSVMTELDTLDWLSTMTELAFPDEAFDETVLPSRDVMLPDDTVLPSRDVIVLDDTVLPSRDVIVLDPASDTPGASNPAHTLNAANVTRCFICGSPKIFAQEVRKH